MAPDCSAVCPYRIQAPRAVQVASVLWTGQWRHPERIPLEMRKEHQDFFRVHDWDRGLWELAGADETPGEKVPLGEIKVKTQVVAGEKDAITETSRIVQIAAGIPDAHLALIPEEGNAPHEECPGAFMDALMEILATPALPVASSEMTKDLPCA